MVVTNELTSFSKSKSKTNKEESQSAKTQVRKVLDQNICYILTSDRTSLNETEAGLNILQEVVKLLMDVSMPASK